MRPVIGKQGKGNAAQLIGPGLQARYGVGADLQNFDAQLLELFEVRTEPGDLVLSPAGEGHRQERHDGRPAAITGERNFLIGVVCGEREVRRCATWFEFHAGFPLVCNGKAASEEYPRASLPAIHSDELFTAVRKNIRLRAAPSRCCAR